MLLYPLNYYLSNDNPYFRIITEFQSPDFHDPLFLLFAAGIVALMLLGGHGKRSRVGDALLISAFTLQALVSARQVSVCALVLAPYLAMRLSDRYWWGRCAVPISTLRSIHCRELAPPGEPGGGGRAIRHATARGRGASARVGAEAWRHANRRCSLYRDEQPP